MLLTSTALTQPVLKRLWTFAASPTGKKPLNTDVFVQIRPLNCISIPEQTPVVSFIRTRVLQTRKPSQRNTERAASEETLHTRYAERTQPTPSTERGGIALKSVEVHGCDIKRLVCTPTIEPRLCIRKPALSKVDAIELPKMARSKTMPCHRP